MNSRTLCTLLLSVAIAVSIARAQCPSTWVRADASQTALAVAPYANGDAVVIGTFTSAPGIAARYIARYHQASGSWTAFGPGLNIGEVGYPRAVITLPDDDVIVSGELLNAGGNACAGVARFDSATRQWHSYGTTFSSSSWTALERLGSGRVVVGASSRSGALHVYDSASDSWAPINPTLSGAVIDMAPMSDGRVLVGGRLSVQGSSTIHSLAIVSESGQFTLLPEPPVDVRTVAQLLNGSIAVAGLRVAPATANFAIWNPTTNQWVEQHAPSASDFRASLALPGGDLLLGGTLSPSVQPQTRTLLRYSSSSGQFLAPSPINDLPGNSVSSLAMTVGGDLYAVGVLFDSQTAPTRSVAHLRANATAWELPGDSSNGATLAIAKDAQNALYIGGRFTSIAGASCNRVAYWSPDVSVIRPLSSGVDNSVESIHVLSNGEVAVGGWFAAAGGQAASRIAIWSPTMDSWRSLGSGVDDVVYAIRSLSNGDLVVGGRFVVAGGQVVNGIARYSFASQTWTRLGNGFELATGTPTVVAIEILPNDDIVACGAFDSSSGTPTKNIARWSAQTQTWSPLGLGLQSGIPFCLKLLQNGSLAAGGSFAIAGGQPTSFFATWNFNTSMWTAHQDSLINSVRAIHQTDSGRVVMTGSRRSEGNIFPVWFLTGRNSSFSENFDGLNPSGTALETRGEEVIVGQDFARMPLRLVSSGLPPGYSTESPLASAFCRYSVDGFSVRPISSDTVTASWFIESPHGSGVYVPLTPGRFVEQSSGFQFEVNWFVQTNTIPPLQTVNVRNVYLNSHPNLWRIRGALENSCGSTQTVVFERSLTDCAADFNCSGEVNTFDILFYLSAWFGGERTADLDGRGLDRQDIFDFLNLWFTGVGCN